MFKCLEYLQGRLASSALLQAWPSMDHRTFLVIIMATVHDLWITLLQSEEACTMVLLYYKSDQSVLRINGGTPFVATAPSISLNAVLSQWLLTLTDAFLQIFSPRPTLSATFGLMTGLIFFMATCTQTTAVTAVLAVVTLSEGKLVGATRIAKSLAVSPTTYLKRFLGT